MWRLIHTNGMKRTAVTCGARLQSSTIGHPSQRWNSFLARPTPTITSPKTQPHLLIPMACPSPYYVASLQQQTTFASSYHSIHHSHRTNFSTSTNAESTVPPLSSLTPPSSASSSSSSSPPATSSSKSPSFFSSLVGQTLQWGELVKFKLSFVVGCSSVFGYALAGSDSWTWSHGLATSGGTLLCAFSAAILNQWWEIKFDALMPRTKHRPLVTGKISERKAIAGAAAFAATGTGLLHWASHGDWVTPTLGLATIALYILAYTPMKQRHRWNTEFGAFVGALPVSIGFSGAMANYTHHMQVYHQLPLPYHALECLLLPHHIYGFMFLFAWQMQHFMTIAHRNQDQYAKGGYVMMRDKPALNKGIVWTGVLCLMPFGAYGTGIEPMMFVPVASALNAALAYYYWRWWRTFQDLTPAGESERSTTSRSVMLAGFAYFFAMVAAIWFFQNDNKYHIATTLIPNEVRWLARHFCPYVHTTTPSDNKTTDASTIDRSSSMDPFQTPIDSKLTPCTYPHIKNDSKCIYIRLVHPDTLKQYEPETKPVN